MGLRQGLQEGWGWVSLEKAARFGQGWGLGSGKGWGLG